MGISKQQVWFSRIAGITLNLIAPPLPETYDRTPDPQLSSSRNGQPEDRYPIASIALVC